MRTHLLVCALALALPAAAEEAAPPPAAAVAQELPPADDLGVDAALSASVQRFGALLEVKGHWRHRLYDSTDEAFKDNSIGISLVNQVAPIFVHSGAQVDFMPTSFLRVSAGYQFVGYFSAMGSMRTASNCRGAAFLPASDPTCDYQPDLPSTPGKGGVGHRAFVEALLQVKISRFLAIGGARFDRWWMKSLDDTNGDDYWVNELSGQPQAMADNVISGGGALLFEAMVDGPGRPQILVGVADDLSWVVRSDVFHHKLGPVGILRVPKWRAFRELTVAIAVQFYTHERYLVGKVPFFGISLGGSTGNFLGG